MQCICISSLYLEVSSLKNESLLFFSHINQKTQFENPVLEAKKKLSQETAAIQQAVAAPSQGNSIAAQQVPFTTPSPFGS